MGSSGGSRSYTSSETSIPPEFRPYFTRLFERAEGASYDVPPQAYQGERIAPLEPQQEASLRQQQALAGQFGDLGASTMQFAQDQLSGQYLHPASNPYLQQTIMAGIRPITEQFTQQILPQIRSQAIQQGAWGGNREGITEGLAASGTTQNIADMVSRMLMQNYATERGYQQQAPQMLQFGAGLQQLAPQMLGQVGDIRRSIAQAQIEADRQAYMEQQQAPFLPLAPLAAILQGGDVGAVRTTTYPQPAGGGVAGGIQGGLGGAASLGALGSVFGPVGTGIGALLGGGLGAIGGSQ